MTSTEIGTSIGVTGSPARAVVTPWGALRFADGRGLDWWVAADDRSHDPKREPSVQQRLIDGTPVVETVMRVPKGVVEQRAYAAVGGAGLAVLEVENRSPLPVAVIVSRRDVLSARAPAPVPPGIDLALPEGASSYPLGHGTTIRVAVPLESRPHPVATLPSAHEVARGWRRRVDMAPRFAVPDATLAESLTAARCRVLLDPLPSLEDDPAGALVAASERARLREPGGLHADDIAAALTVWARDHRRHRRLVWTEAVMIERAAELLDAAGERDGADDARRLRARWRTERAPADAPSGLWRLPWLERSLVVTDGDRIEVLPGLPAGWFGQSVDVHEVPVDRDRLSFALRWHGTRAALLWECTASRPLGCARLDASWSTSRARGEALLAPPAK